jgi:hypothetical protein
VIDLRRLRPPFGWHGRALYLWPLVIESWVQRVLASAALAVVLVCWYASGSALVPVVATIAAVAGIVATTLPFGRSWPVWDVLVWENKLAVSEAEQDQIPNAHCLARAGRALMARQPGAVRSELANLSAPSPALALIGLFFLGEADLLEGRQPDVDGFRRAVAAGRDDHGPAGEVMAAILESGSEWLAGRDWRAPLRSCRTTLGVRMNPLRALWPVRNLLALLAITPLVPWAYWLWGR